MNHADAQAETEPEYFDPEEPDMSEQQFAASLGVSAERPQFVVDATETEASRRPEPARRSAGEDRVATAESPISGDESLSPDEKPRAGELKTSVAGDESRPGLTAADLGTSSGHTATADWRNLVSAKVSNYRTRKPHKERYPSLRLPFEPVVRRGPAESECAPLSGASSGAVREPAPIPPPPLPDSAPRILLEATARVLEFPRPAGSAERDELAEPVMDRPRILEAPELLPPPPAMGGILIEPQPDPEPERRPGFDVPLQSAPLGRRVVAGLFDGFLVGVATAGFTYIVARVGGSMPPLRSTVFLAASLMVLFWAAYQYLLLVFTARTPGLWLAKLRLSRFDGGSVARGLRRWRVLASLLSLTSLGLGYAWCFLDEDQLSWHDRITKTHLAPNGPRQRTRLC
jgi:uncharacterized RDD family membrane protein YckC